MFVLVPSGRGWCSILTQVVRQRASGRLSQRNTLSPFLVEAASSYGGSESSADCNSVSTVEKKKDQLLAAGGTGIEQDIFFFFEKRSKHLKHFEDANKENRRLRNQCNVVRWRHKGLWEKWESRKVRPEYREEHAELNIEVAWKVITTAGKQQKKVFKCSECKVIYFLVLSQRPF